MKKLLSFLLLIIPLSLFGQTETRITPWGIKDQTLSIWGIKDNSLGMNNDFINAANYGFLPTTTASANVAAWNSMPSGKKIKITTPGTYQINNTLWLKSNTTYEFCAGCTVKKATGSSFSHIFGNYGMLTLATDNNIKFYGNGLRLQVNGIDTYSLTDTNISPVPRCRAQFQLFHVINFIIDDFYIDDGLDDQFSFSMSDCHNGEISNIDIRAEKDGISIVSSSDLNIHNCILDTWDDYFFLGVAYAVATPYIANTENIYISDIVLKMHTPTGGGFAARIYDASWTNWTNGQTYHWNEYCINEGKIYANETAENKVASVAPTHTSGAVTGADGIKWWYVQNGTITHADIKNITFKNIDIQSDKGGFRFYNNWVTTGTEGTAIIDDIVFDNISFKTSYANYFLQHRANCGTITVKNTSFTSGTLAGGFFYGEISSGTSTLEELIIDNCIFDLSSTYSFVNSGTGYSFTKLTINNSQITATNKYLIPVSPNIRINISCNNTTFIGLDRFVYSAANNSVTTCTLTNCTFSTSLLAVVVVLNDGCTFNYISTGTTYIDPSEHLFYVGYAGLSIDVSDSHGTVPAHDVRNSVLVTVIQCDIPYL